MSSDTVCGCATRALHVAGQLTKGLHTLRMSNLNGEGVNLGWIALIPVEELPMALDPARLGRLAAGYLAATEVEFKLRNPDFKK